jgi:osmotically-inducible protein OsmY
MHPKKKGGTTMRTIRLLMFMGAAVVLLATSMPLHASEADDRIESSAQKSYVFKTYLEDDDIKVRSRDGVVTLTGTVSDESHRSLAQETVAELPGVKSVNNRLEVKGERLSKNSDAWIRTKVKTTLLLHRNVSGIKTKVDVKDGIVTLKGVATSEAQKELAAEYAKDVEGVKDVKNKMTVSETTKTSDGTMGEFIDDASITAQVKMALLFHRSTSAISTDVETNDGVVILSGKAQNPEEKALVTKLVTDIRGVKDVVNNMTVEESLPGSG